MSITELIDGMIVDCNSAVGAVAKGEYISWCKTMYELVQKLAIAKTAIMNTIKESGEDAQNDQQGRSEVADEEVPTESLVSQEGHLKGNQKVSGKRTVIRDGKPADLRAGHVEGSQTQADTRESV